MTYPFQPFLLSSFDLILLVVCVCLSDVPPRANSKQKKNEKLDQRSKQLGYQLTSSTNNLWVGVVVYYLIILY